MLQDAPETHLLQAIDLTCERGDRRLFSELSFELAAGQLLQVKGANGSGKTSLLRILCGLLQAGTGKILWRGVPIAQQRSGYLSQIHYAGHLPGIKLGLTPSENLRFAAVLQGGEPQLSIAAALEQVELFGFEDEPASSLSAGQRRRISLASLLVTRGKLWVLDEPFTTLDKAGTTILERLINAHLDHNGCVVMASHSPHTIDPDRVQTLQLTA